MHNANVEIITTYITSVAFSSMLNHHKEAAKKVELNVFSLRKCFYLKNVCLSIRYSFTTVLQSNYYNSALKIEYLKARNGKKILVDISLRTFLSECQPHRKKY